MPGVGGLVLDPILGPGGQLPSGEWAGLGNVPTQVHTFISPHLSHPCGADLSKSCPGLLVVWGTQNTSAAPPDFSHISSCKVPKLTTVTLLSIAHPLGGRLLGVPSPLLRGRAPTMGKGCSRQLCMLIQSKVSIAARRHTRLPLDMGRKNPGGAALPETRFMVCCICQS